MKYMLIMRGTDESNAALKAGFEESEGVREVLLLPRAAHVLEHPHAYDLIEALPRDVAVIAELDAEFSFESRLPHALAGEPMLFLAEGDAEAGDPEILRGVDQEPAPAAADVQESLAGPEAQLAADQLQLGGLRLGEGERRAVELAVGHPDLAGGRHVVRRRDEHVDDRPRRVELAPA